MRTLERIFGKFTKPFRLYLRLSQNMKKVENYRISKESSASTHICRLPSRANRAYSSGLSIANASNAHCEQGVVRNPSSATLQSIRRRYPSNLVTSMLLGVHIVFCIYKFHILPVLSLLIKFRRN